MRVSVVIVSLNGRARISMPLDALRRGTPPPDQVIVVDNGSTDGLAAFVQREYPEVTLVSSPRTLGFAGGNNLGILNADGDLVILLNDDTEPEPDWIAPLTEYLEARPEVGVVGCRLLYPGSRKVQHLGAVVHPNGLTDHVAWGEEESASADREPFEVPYVTGAAFGIRRAALASVGLLDDGYWPIYFEELDWCERARSAGWGIYVVPRSTVVHHESQTTLKYSPRFLQMYHKNRVRFLLKNRSLGAWPGILRAEARWMVGHTPWDSLWPCALAYSWGAVQAVEIATRRLAGEVF